MRINATPSDNNRFLKGDPREHKKRLAVARILKYCDGARSVECPSQEWENKGAKPPCLRVGRKEISEARKGINDGWHLGKTSGDRPIKVWLHGEVMDEVWRKPQVKHGEA
jgi:hypothetical protein